MAKIISTTKFDIIKKELKDKIVETIEDINLNERESNLNQDNSTKLAYICNWDQQCGISTYSKFVLDEVKTRVKEYKIFSEYPQSIETPYTDGDDIVHCWKRGTNLKDLVEKLKDYNPNFILIQHEWGVFPNAGNFMSFIMELKKLHIPTCVVLHSVYNHLDKSIPLSILDNVIVHSNAAKVELEKLKFKGGISVIPHGCPELNSSPEVWNIFQTPYLLFGYGFGFKYKGVEMAIDAIKHLKDTDDKFKNILYIYACSESESSKGIHENYYNILSKKVEENGLHDNVVLLRGFLEPELLDTYLRTVKMVLFPYISEPNGVFGSSGAIKIAMSYNLPVVASKSHLFDDVDGYVIRAEDYKDLAEEIDQLFSDGNYRQRTITKAHEFITSNTWSITADRYINTINEIKSKY